MKFKKNKIWIYFVGMIALIVGAISCGSPSDSYDEFVLDRQIVYPEKVDTVIALSGYKRAVLKIAKPSDPRVNSVGIFWNLGDDSLIVQFHSNKDTLRVEIDELQIQGTYTFTIHTYYKESGKKPWVSRGVGTSVSAHIYSDIYVNQLVNRQLISIIEKME